ncbi:MULTISPECIES: DNA/RNA helicase domain-containing protein [Pseudomonas]|uniref:DUF2075 domain-containing protein n=1 Tax=Pseudomonas mosselii TaxID=78327 RepID=A0A5R8Z096_9PSED|nr:DNA/RNA helicase domain-containing protein [Pseudomonas mosselii]TLP59011.1 DUF2075 domain-containing protein [Pseudomonas mosselii]
MRFVNLISLIQASESLGEEVFQKFLQFHGIKLRKGELEDLSGLVEELDYSPGEMKVFDGFYLGYRIPQIGKEFDLLRFSDDAIVNIELKSTCTKEKAREQLRRNRYYLAFTKKKVRAFTYISGSKKLYELDEDSNLVEAKASALKALLKRKVPVWNERVDALFDPSNYLVSPFNATDRFLNNEYFLTHQQEEYKNKIMESIEVSKSYRFISVTGSAGTGKTLLVYDIAKGLQVSGYKLAVIHCGIINDGQSKLKDHGWDISEIKEYKKFKIERYDVVVVDEAQRIRKAQLDILVKWVEDSGRICIFSYDKAQTLSREEEAMDVASDINKVVQDSYSLSEKIRTNKEISDFIKALFNNKRNHPLSRRDNIEISYFDNVDDAKSYLSSLDGNDWEVIRFTPSLYNVEHHEKYFSQVGNTSHQVIGQEFDGVAIPIDHYFSYRDNGELYYKGRAHYHVSKMLFQNITRARKRLKLVIIKNNEILTRCASILQ